MLGFQLKNKTGPCCPFSARNLHPLRYLLFGELQEYLRNFAQSASLTLVHVSSCLNNWYCTSMKQDHCIQKTFHMNDISIINLLLSDLHNLFFILRYFQYKLCMKFFFFHKFIDSQPSCPTSLYMAPSNNCDNY